MYKLHVQGINSMIAMISNDRPKTSKQKLPLHIANHGIPYIYGNYSVDKNPLSTTK